jgi:hypothetical protein
MTPTSRNINCKDHKKNEWSITEDLHRSLMIKKDLEKGNEQMNYKTRQKNKNCESYFIYAAISPPNLRLLGGTDSAFGNYMWEM